MKKSPSLQTMWGEVRQNVSVVLVAALVVLAICEGLVIHRSVQILLESQRVETTPKTQLVRVNFGLYDSIASRFARQTSFTPRAVTTANPFGNLDFEEPK